MVEALDEAVRGHGRPFLGICVGMQLMAERGREYEVTRGLGLDRGRGRAHRAGRPEAENPAYGLEHARRSAGRIRCSTASRSGRRVCTPISCIPSAQAGGSLRSRRRSRLWRPGHRDRRPRQHGRHPVPSGEKPAARPRADRQFPEVEAVMPALSGVRRVILFPAIDLKDGLCVRLEQGDMARATVFQPRSGGAGARLRVAGLRISACRRSRRRLCRQAGQCAAVEAHPRGDRDSGAARRRHPRHGDDRGLARQGRHSA